MMLRPNPHKPSTEELIARAMAVREIIDRASRELAALTRDLRKALDDEEEVTR